MINKIKLTLVFLKWKSNSVTYGISIASQEQEELEIYSRASILHQESLM